MYNFDGLKPRDFLHHIQIFDVINKNLIRMHKAILSEFVTHFVQDLFWRKPIPGLEKLKF